jgi:hypothetical protein
VVERWGGEDELVWNYKDDRRTLQLVSRRGRKGREGRFWGGPPSEEWFRVNVDGAGTGTQGLYVSIVLQKP